MTDDALAEYAGVSEQELTELLAILSGTDILELDVSVASAHLSLRRAPAPAAAAPAIEPSAVPVDDHAATLAITSPLVGVFHPAVQPGQQVQAGQPIGAIEALGMPTSVDAPQGGSVDQVLVEDGQPVEYGQPLLVLRRD